MRIFWNLAVLVALSSVCLLIGLNGNANADYSADDSDEMAIDREIYRLADGNFNWLLRFLFREPRFAGMKLTVIRRSGKEYLFDYPVVRGEGIYICPYATFIAFPREYYCKLSGDDSFGKDIEVLDGVDTSKWGIPGNKVTRVRLGDDETHLPGSCAPRMFLHYESAGIRWSHVPVTASAYDGNYMRLENIGDNVADVALYFAENGRLIREAVNIKAPGNSGYVRSHVFDFIFEKHEDAKYDNPRAHYPYPKAIFLKLWRYEGELEPLDLGHKPTEPGEFGMTYEYLTNDINNKLYLAEKLVTRPAFVVDHVYVREFPDDSIEAQKKWTFVTEDAIVEVRVRYYPVYDEYDIGVGNAMRAIIFDLMYNY